MKNFFASLMLFSSLSALADAEVAASRCDYILKLSDSQKLEIKELSKASAEKLLQLATEIKKAKLESDQVLSKVEASKEEAVQAASLLGAKMEEVQAVKVAEKLALLFDVLTPEQRLKKVKCEALRQSTASAPSQQPRFPERHYRVPTTRQMPRGPGRIEHRPMPNHRPGRVIVYRPGRRPFP